MECFGLAGIFAGCTLIAYQDFSSRYIHLSGLMLLCVGLLLYSGTDGYHVLLLNTLINVVFLTFLLLLLHVYFFLRRGQWSNLFNRYIGVGDVLLLLALAPAANLFNYLLILIAGSVMALVYWFVVNFVWRRRMVRIPLAGVLTLTFLTMLAACNLRSVNLIRDMFFSF